MSGFNKARRSSSKINRFDFAVCIFPGTAFDLLDQRFNIFRDFFIFMGESKEIAIKADSLTKWNMDIKREVLHQKIEI
jgi:hypothetical protein